jgi:hypothetical protein
MRHPAQLMLWLALAASLTGCASAEPLGVRDAWSGAPITRVALVPPYTTQGLGMDAAQRDALLETTRAAAEAELARRGVQVISPAELGHQLTEHGAWQEFMDGMSFERSLRGAFEIAPQGALPIEVTTLRSLAKRGVLADPLLFVELAYHTQGTCRVVPEEGDTVVLAPDGGRALPTQCVTTHLYGKLVLPSSAAPLWYNHMLRELHAAALAPEDAARNIVQAMTLLLSGEHGLGALLKR